MPRSSLIPVVGLASLLLGTLLLLQHHKSYTADEVYELQHLAQSWDSAAANPDGFPPLYNWLLGKFVRVAKASNARVLSAISSVIGLFFVAATGRQFGPKIGNQAAIFYAFSACQLEYAQQSRAYSLYICFGAIVIWSAVNSALRQKVIDWIAIVLSSTAILWTHYYAAPFLIGVWLFVLGLGWRNATRNSHLRRFLICFTASTVASLGLLIPWIEPFRIDFLSPPPVEAINPVDWTGLAYTYLTLLQGWCVGPSQMELFEWPKIQAVLSIAPWALASGVMFASLTYYAIFGAKNPVKGSKEELSTTQNRHDPSALKWQLALVVAVPIVSASMAWIVGSSFVPRYMAVLVVPLSLFLGWAGRLDWPVSWRAISSWGLVVLNLLSFSGRNFNDRYDRENYRQLLDYVMAEDQTPRLVVLSHYLGNAIKFHMDGEAQIFMIGLNSDEPNDWTQVREQLDQAPNGRLWVVVDWMRADDLRLARRDEIFSELGARHVRRISGTLELLVANQPQNRED
ncbi:MAG: glycosyltransferase family 39 protein [Pirellulales bacterium]